LPEKRGENLTAACSTAALVKLAMLREYLCQNKKEKGPNKIKQSKMARKKTTDNHAHNPCIETF
jgi:hypothetical protein